jgi:predicted transport protein
MKLQDILKEIREAKKVNIDDLITKGYTLGPDEKDPNTGAISSVVYNASDLKKNLNLLYNVYNDITKYKGSSKDSVKNIAKKITKDISQTVKDIKELEQYIELIRRGL